MISSEHEHQMCLYLLGAYSIHHKLSYQKCVAFKSILFREIYAEIKYQVFDTNATQPNLCFMTTSFFVSTKIVQSMTIIGPLKYLNKNIFQHIINTL